MSPTTTDTCVFLYRPVNLITYNIPLELRVLFASFGKQLYAEVFHVMFLLFLILAGGFKYCS
jgi:hypothetical protein